MSGVQTSPKKQDCGAGCGTFYNTVFRTSVFLLFTATSVGNNIAVQMMGYYMPIYPGFLLYGTTFLYTLMFGFGAFCNGESLFLRVKGQKFISSLKKWAIVFLLGVFTALNGICAQIAIPFVEPELKTIISQSSTPVTWAVFFLLFNHRVHFSSLLSFLLILFGLFFGSAMSYGYGSGSNSEFSNNWFFVLLVIMSAIPTAFETILQEVSYKYQLTTSYCVMFWYNLFSLIVYALYIPFTMIQPFGTCQGDETVCFDQSTALVTVPCTTLKKVFQHQFNSLRCFVGFGQWGAPCCDYKGAVWAWVFCICYFLSFSYGANILKKEGSAHYANLSALTYPITAMLLWAKFLCGEYASEFRWWILMSFVAIFGGNLMYNNQKLWSKLKMDCVIVPGIKSCFKSWCDQGEEENQHGLLSEEEEDHDEEDSVGEVKCLVNQGMGPEVIVLDGAQVKLGSDSVINSCEEERHPAAVINSCSEVSVLLKHEK